MGVPPKFWNFRYSQAISYLVTSETQLQPHYGAVSKITTENVGEEMSMYAPTRPAMIQSNTYFRSHSLQMCIQKLPLRILDMHGNKCRDITGNEDTYIALWPVSKTLHREGSRCRNCRKSCLFLTGCSQSVNYTYECLVLRCSDKVYLHSLVKPVYPRHL